LYYLRGCNKNINSDAEMLSLNDLDTAIWNIFCEDTS
jgi:hypothetical protein